MLAVGLQAFPEGQAGFGVHQVNEVANAKVTFKLGLFSTRQGVILVLHGKNVHPIEVVLVKAEQPKHGLGCSFWQVGLFGVDHAGDDRGFRVGGRVLRSCHGPTFALTDGTLASLQQNIN
jgi:hypothetical protein